MKFSEGDVVLAKHPATAEYHVGKILSVRGEQYKVQFEAGNEHSVHSNDIRVSRPSRSVTRSRSKGRMSPSRYSPSRKSPSRRSPGRPASSVNRKLRGRLAKVTIPRVEIKNDVPNDENIVSKKSINDNDSPMETLPLQFRLNELGVTRRSMRLYSATLKPEPDHKTITLTRNINRAASLPLERKSQVLDFIYDTKERGHSVQRDQTLLKRLNYEEDVKLDSQVIEKREKEIKMIREPQEWGGWFGTLILIFLTPMLTILPQLMCTTDQCKFEYPDIPTDLNSYINLKAFVTYLGFFLFVTIVSITPIGKKVDGPQSRIGRLQYRLNGFLCALLSLIIFITCIYKEFEVGDFIIENYIQFSISGWILGVVLSLLLFIKGSKAPVANLNIYGSTNSVIYNFWQGREINPRIGPLDIKMNFFRTAMITMIIINLAIVTKAIEEAENYSIEHLNMSVLLVASLQIIYSMDALFFESTILTTFEVMYEGTGYMLCTGYMLYPFLPTLTTKYMLYHKEQFNYWLALPAIGFIIGYLLYRISNSQKNEFRKNPLSQSLPHLDTIPTIRGKKLIVSGLWGHVRHPNYLGDIIMWWSISCTSLACDILPYYYAIMCTVLLVHRAIRDNERCKMRYGLAWEQYISRVKYMILYRIF
ncbi:delta(14)-sterol reductase TM7SF2 [Hylaeus volcanicus]|uniref:delta(14)-sterol reductase TM7SF2 n=1 Tax=Hylaeus volcanicus TaxID=313075 RepID=UPI0023B874DB|nr:delta(14)-sterol reductase TM7SF2 [Hylaeus volcanicus]